MSSDGVVMRAAEREDVAAVLRLWSEGRSGHASQPDSAEAVERLLAHADEAACGLWSAAGYELDREIGRFVRNA